VLADTAIRAHDLDEVKAMEAKQRAEDAMKSKLSAEETAKVQAEIAASVAQLEAIKRLRRRR